MLDIVASYHCMQFQGKLINQTWENNKKPSFGPDLSYLVQIRAAIFFSKLWLCQSLDVMVSYHHVQYQKKLILTKTSDGWTDGQTEAQTEESDFIGRYPTNVKRSKINSQEILKCFQS